MTTTVHRTIDGRWDECADKAACSLKFHVDDMSVADAMDLPLDQLLPLFEIVDPPKITDSSGNKEWSFLMGRKQVIHRDYDLPAVVNDKKDNYNKVIMAWYYKGHVHRENDLPAMIWSHGKLEWYHLGYKHREGGKPAVVHPDGRVEYWDMGNQIG